MTDGTSNPMPEVLELPFFYFVAAMLIVYTHRH